MPRTLLAVALLFLARIAPAQSDAPAKLALDGLSARCIGPANMGGRVVDLAVVENNPDTYYVALATGGVFKTTDAGKTLYPVFDSQPTLCIGSVAVCQGKPDVVYVGSGEGNPRNSVSAGNGVYKSSDGGKSWTHCGLADTHHIGRVAVHPTDPDTAYVAALGHFWGPNFERGLYKTTDGGKTWKLSKFIDEDTGFVDVQMDPSDPDTLYAAAWQQRRDAFSGGNPKTQWGDKGGLFKTSDAGKTWEKMGGGLPDRAYGRCGLSVYRKDPNVIYAVVQTDKTDSRGNAGQRARAGEDKPEIGGIFRSDDKGKTWKKLNDLVPRPFYYGQIRVDPNDDKIIYVLGVSFTVSTDGGKTFTVAGRTMHADHHAMWINPKDSTHLINGNDGGLYVSKDKGKTFEANRGMAIGQFYGVAVDSRTPYRVYGGLQDNGSWGGPSATAYPDGVTQSDWRRFLAGDGFQAQVDPKDPDTVYLESQYGNLARIDVTKGGGMGGKGGTKNIRPPGQKGGPTNRYNWNAPMLVSPHDAKTIYYGANFLFKSTNRGDAWEKISPDLTRAAGPVTNSGHTLSTIAESPVTKGELWVGTDDGNVWLSKDGGKAWTDLSNNVPLVPRDRTISRIECSHADAGTAYLAIDRHRNDDFRPYLYVTRDHGKTWTPLVNGLPMGAVVGVVRESSKAKNLLFAGTELGLYVSLDAGAKWQRVEKSGLPAATRVDDLVIHPRERELVIGTHARSVWVMDIAPLEQLTPAVLKADAHLFDLKPVTVLKPKERAGEPAKGFKAANPKPVATYWVGAGTKSVEFSIRNGEQDVTGAVIDAPKPGLHTVTLPTTPGEYTVTLKAGGATVSKKVTVKLEGEAEKKADE